MEHPRTSDDARIFRRGRHSRRRRRRCRVGDYVRHAIPLHVESNCYNLRSGSVGRIFLSRHGIRHTAKGHHGHLCRVWLLPRCSPPEQASSSTCCSGWQSHHTHRQCHPGYCIRCKRSMGLGTLRRGCRSNSTSRSAEIEVHEESTYYAIDILYIRSIIITDRLRSRPTHSFDCLTGVIRTKKDEDRSRGRNNTPGVCPMCDREECYDECSQL